MKLLIKIFIREMNPYDICQILGALNSVIEDKNNTKIILMTNDSTFDFEPYEYYYLPEYNIQKMINYKLDEFEWDIVLPLFRPIIATKNFDTLIKNLYKQKFENLDGVLWINDDIQSDLAILAIVGRRYYEKFGYIYNPVYFKKNFEEEFTEILKINKKYYYYDKTTIFKILPLKLDDDNIFDFRKKINFEIYE
jgi:hypothetical protein